MQGNTFVVFALVLISLQSVLVEGLELDAEQKKICLKFSRKTLKMMMKSFNQCNEKLQLHHISGEEYQKKIGCVVKCVMQSVNVLDAEGKMTEATLKASIESQLPAEYVQFAHENLVTCLKEYALDPKDEYCKSYLDMGTCMQGATAEMCGGETPML